MWPPGTAGCAPAWPKRSTRPAGPGPGPARFSTAPRPAGELAGDLSLARAGRLLGESFLPGPVAAELEQGAGGGGAGASAGPAGPGGAAGAGRAAVGGAARPGRPRPLALHPLVRLYRQADAAAGRVLPGPLRIVVAIAAPGQRRRAWCWITSGTCAACSPRSAPPARTTPTCGWCRSPPWRRSARNWSAAPAHVLHIYCHGQPGAAGTGGRGRHGAAGRRG